MFRLKKYITICAGIIALLLLIPALIPTQKYKNLIISKVKSTTSRDLAIDQDVKLSLLPTPTLTLQSVKLSSLPNAIQPYLFEADTIEASLNLLALLKGKIVISNVNIDKPKVILEKLSGNRNNWMFNQEPSTPKARDNLNNQVVSKKINLPFLINQISIKKGELQYIELDNSVQRIDDINLDLKMYSIEGPFDANATLKLSGQNIDLRASVREISSVIPISLEAKFLTEKISVDGSLYTARTAFDGSIKSEGDLSGIKGVILTGLPQGLKNKYKLSAAIKLSKEQINIDDLDFRIGDIAAKASVNYLFNHNSGAFTLNINPGNISFNINSQSSENAIINLKTNSLRSFLNALKLEIDTTPKLFSTPIQLQSNLLCKEQELNINNINLYLDKALINGSVKLKNWVNTPTLSYNLSTDNAKAIFDLINIYPSIQITDFEIRGNTRKSAKNFITESTISTAKSQIDFKTMIDVNKLSDISNLDVSISGNSLNQTLKYFKKDFSNKNLEKFFIALNLKGDLKNNVQLKIDKSNIMIGSENVVISGDGQLKFNNSKPNANININISKIDLNKLLASDSVQNSSPNTNNQEPRNQSVNPQTLWSQEKFDLSFLDSIDYNFQIQVDEFKKDALVFDSTRSSASINDGVFNINSFSGNLFDGKVNGSGRLTKKGELNFKILLDKIQVKNIIPSQGKINITQGAVNFDASLESKGLSIYHIIKNLNGIVNLDGVDGRISGFDLSKIVESLNKVTNLQTALNVFDQSLLHGSTHFQNLKHNMVINDGIMTITHSSLNANGGNVETAGTINLPQYTADIDVIIHLEAKNIPTIKTHIYGPLDNVNYKLDIKELQKFLANDVLNNVVDEIKNGKKPKDFIKNIIGNNKGSSNQDNHKEPNSKQEPINKLINQGLKKLFK